MQLNNRDALGSNLQSEINITPLVDVVLVLLIIFMVVVPLLLQGYDVSIPRSSVNTTPAAAEASQVILSINPTACQILKPQAGGKLPADCRVSLDEQEIPVANLPARITEALGGRPADQRVLFLAADDRLNYEAVLQIVDLAKSGVDDLRIEFITTN
jgi:biopolymer transport protein ExbD